MRHNFRIPIGDWSGDGHGQAEWYSANSALPLDDVREAYFKSCKSFDKKLCPEQICSEYEESQISVELLNKIKELSGIDISGEVIEEGDTEVCVDIDLLVEYLVWFINQGNPAVDVKLEKQDDMFPFYGCDSKKRHISFIGYGLLGN